MRRNTIVWPVGAMSAWHTTQRSRRAWIQSPGWWAV
uniref:Uncharacterized protein n=1 Tax=Myoviridae sp. ctZNX6 TaxID=2825127 RepID=A0A8S5PC07_9CAUD|nr:MAG TPA: hypothetical protein [Myoviridae sp. ctZNX6]